ncbi:addiction module protein [Lamprobacter modestohalophilus]|uniref:Addiction module protein n=1 Tax=Lamprobacter modestohalophilus TaxID=1064514 RepID=A0A9X0W8R8_9GAMM|nr:addiction module protein [Lamprobacter modestohalophilus]MBK1618889.1 addiction module protein [Lamprobacter modestohalophilus]MCF7979879.1 addiction module protein [Chromatiaceae bacterium]MCF7994515.1 addiction module protein [Chromatiaceae bacterium]
MNTKELIDQAIALPVEERALVVDSLLRSLNPPQSEIDAQWAKESRRRLTALRSGQVEAISGEVVFQRVWDRFK